MRGITPDLWPAMVLLRSRAQIAFNNLAIQVPG